MSPQHVHLHFDPDQRLHRTVVEVPHQAGTLGSSGSAPQSPQKIEIVYCWSDLPDEVLQEPQFLLCTRRKSRVQQKDSAGEFLGERK